jgi:hypothetical protein
LLLPYPRVYSPSRTEHRGPGAPNAPPTCVSPSRTVNCGLAAPLSCGCLTHRNLLFGAALRVRNSFPCILRDATVHCGRTAFHAPPTGVSPSRTGSRGLGTLLSLRLHNAPQLFLGAAPRVRQPLCMTRMHSPSRTECCGRTLRTTHLCLSVTHGKPWAGCSFGMWLHQSK